MRWRRIGAVLGAAFVVLAAVVAATGVMVVDVKDADGTHIVVPVPLLVAETAAHFAPTQGAATAVNRQLDRARKYLPAAEEVLAAIAESPDFELVDVEEGAEHVRVSKVGDALHVHVEGPRENVEVNVPFALARQALSQARNGRIEPSDLVAALRRARLTRLADVSDGGEHVSITIW